MNVYNSIFPIRKTTQSKDSMNTVTVMCSLEKTHSVLPVCVIQGTSSQAIKCQ